MLASTRLLTLPITIFAVSALLAQAPSVTVLPSGVEVSAGETTLRVTALRDDVLRVTAGRAGAMPEDASWAVLAAARTATVPVVQDVAAAGGAAGFHTKQMQVRVSADLRVTVLSPEGKVLSEDAEPIAWKGKGFRVAKRMEDQDHFFGLGDKAGPLDRRGMDFVMWNSDAFGFQESTDPIYKSIPFFLDVKAGEAMGVLFDNTWRTFFDFGKQFAGEYSFSAPDGPLTYYLMYGPEPKKVVETYAWLTGPTPLPPLWSLGFQQSRYSYETEARLMEVAGRLRADKIPADALYMDIDYQVGNRPFTVDAVKYPHFPEMVAQLKRDNFHLVVITDLHVARLPDAGYAPYDTGVAGDHFLKMPDGSTYVGAVWPGPSVFPEFTQASSRAWWGTLYKGFVGDGVAGFWDDMNEPAIFNVPSKTMPDEVQDRIDEPGFRRRTANQAEIHNVYGMENSRATFEGLLQLEPEVRPFVLTRASYAGGQRYAATWTGDNSSTWNHLRMTIPQLESLGLSGFGMSGADVGGFAGSPSPELLTKWIEVAAFQPIDRDHAAKGTRDHEPWVDGAVQEAIRRRFIAERYKLMPYLYTAAEEMSRTGLPIMRPLFLEFPKATSDGHPLDLDATGEFLFGGRILVAASPSPEEVAPYEVKLPPGGWFDYWTGEALASGVTGVRDLEQRDQVLAAAKPLMVTPKLEELPVYVRAGTILPMAPLTQSTEERPVGPLTLRVYPATGAATGEACGGTVYQDDGTSYAFRAGHSLRMQFTCAVGADGSLTVRAAKGEGDFKPWWTQVRVEAYGWTPTRRRARVGGRAMALEQAGRAWAVTVAETTGAMELRME